MFSPKAPREIAILFRSNGKQTSGTAEQKVPYEVIRLIEAVIRSKGHFTRAYLVLGGPGWKLRDFYTRGGLKPYINYQASETQHIPYTDYVRIVSFEDFLALACRGKL